MGMFDNDGALEEKRRYLDTANPKAWPSCACGACADYLIRVERPVLGELTWDSDRNGDWGAVEGERYFTACKGCKEMSTWMDAIVAAWVCRNNRE